ncbi:MAG: hypothetical protein ABH882_03570 [Candidatus Omnitrophota bacterium]
MARVILENSVLLLWSKRLIKSWFFLKKNANNLYINSQVCKIYTAFRRITALVFNNSLIGRASRVGSLTEKIDLTVFTDSLVLNSLFSRYSITRGKISVYSKNSFFTKLLKQAGMNLNYPVLGLTVVILAVIVLIKVFISILVFSRLRL